MPYSHITNDQRSELGALLSAQVPIKEIAQLLGKHRSTIWRERRRNQTTSPGSKTHYRADEAQRKTKARRVEANQRFRKISNNLALQRCIEPKLKLGWTPEQISGSLKKAMGLTVFCHETLYQYIYTERMEWIQLLARKRTKYRRKRGTRARVRANLEGKKKRIDTRPQIIEQRSRVGDFEGDTIVGKEKTQRILTLTERRSGKLFASKLETGTAAEVRVKTKLLLSKVPRAKRHSITFDNGSEFADHELIERDNKLDIYFAYPYHSWERGTSENTNGLLRRFFPKGTPFASITQTELDRVTKLINSRPRKRHQYRTPNEVFNEGCTLD